MHNDHGGDHVAVLQQLLIRAAINPVHQEMSEKVTRAVNQGRLIDPYYL